MTYSELVKEAIRKAHEEAKAAAEATQNQVAQFEIGKPTIHAAFVTMIVSFP